MVPPQTPRRTEDLTRRIRDLLRADIIAEAFPGNVLPTEEELRVEFDAPRACVRDALALLQDEGLVTRVRGQGTFVTRGRIWQSLRETHGVEEPADGSIWGGRMTTRVTDWSDVPATPPVARMLRIDVGTPVLRIDYTAYLGDTVIGQATNHLTYPEAGRVTPDMMRIDFYAMLRSGGVRAGESIVLLETGVADEHDAALLGIDVGDAVLVMEQTILDRDGRPIDAAFIRGSAASSTFFSRAGGTAAERGGS